MFVHLQGEIFHCGDDHLVVELNGLGVKVFVPQALARQHQPGERIFLYTHFIVREDAWLLYGFESEVEREYFLMLLGVNGVGPRVAMQVVSTLSIDMLRNAVLSDQADIIGRVPGVGKKTAQKIILYLQDKVGSADVLAGVNITSADSEVLDALTALGYSVVEAQTAIQSIPRGAANDVEERLRLALQFFNQ
ncbi:MAG TPA: Holliday junction branch migration protein RuvA [Bellilinea sp.]|jgi:Holliday junction DNA helicase RuvA|nr:Holliday junction branch migration protein RuvA [Bellilinea sp.]